jgi:DNA repair protein RadA/Sms
LIRCIRCGEIVPKERKRCTCGLWISASVAKTNGILLRDVTSSEINRIQTGPWDHMFGMNWKSGEKGIARTSVTLIGGSPGAGKSTLLLMIADKACVTIKRETIYLATEEPIEQIKARADRLEIENQDKIRMIPLNTGYDFLPEPSKTGLVILDSINGLAGESLREAVSICKTLKQHVAHSGYPAIAISHINKRGDIGGLESLQHEVDCTMTFFPAEENLGEESPRELIVEKNRNGQAYLKMRMLMTEKGLIAEDEGLHA